MQRDAPTRPQLLVLFLASLTPRLIGALWLPNAFGDAYAYTEQIYYLRRSLLNGSFSVSHLFGFWLPLYQLICASVSAIAGSPFYVPKLVSAFCGGALCVVVCLITWELTSSKWLSLTTAAVAAVNPYHVFFSSSAMTDVPHAFLILLCVYCCIKERWILAAILALAAGLMRIESWILIPIVPMAQAFRHSSHPTMSSPSRGRRLPVLVKTILLGLLLVSGPVFWLYVSWKATGSFTRYFEIRNNYIVETLASSLWLSHFSPGRVAFDFVRLIYTCNVLVVYAAVALFLTLLSRNFLDLQERTSLPARLLKTVRNLLATAHGLVLIFFTSHLAFLLLAYFTRNQPEIWPRYGLLFFALGLPLVASRYLNSGVLQRLQPSFAGRQLSATLLLILFFVQFSIQLVDVTRMIVTTDPNLITAEYLEDQRRADPATRVYCEDGAIRVLSGIPLEEFKDQYNSPADDDDFLQSLKDNGVGLLVYKDLAGSRLKGIIERLRSRRLNRGLTLEEVRPIPRKRPEASIIVYRIHHGEVARALKRKE
jgi:hypothetical protein